MSPHQPPELQWQTFRASEQQTIDITSGRTENTVTDIDWTSEAQKHIRSAGPHCPGDRKRLSRKGKGCFCFLRLDKSFWQSLAWRSPAKGTWKRCFWKNVQIDPMFPTRQTSKSKTEWTFEQKHKNPRSPTGRSHFTETLSPVRQQHHDSASPTCLQHPTCRWFCRVECIWLHYICSFQDPGSCEQAVDKRLGSSDQWNEDKGHSFLHLHFKRKSSLETKHYPKQRLLTCLGVKLDTHLSWKPGIEDIETKGIKKLAVLNTLRRQLQDSENCPRRGSPTISGIWASAWATAAKTHTNKLDKVQTTGLRTILGAKKTTSIAEMEKTAGAESLERRWQVKLLIHAQKMKRMSDHPLHQKLKDPTKNRMKRRRLNHFIRQQQKEHVDILLAEYISWKKNKPKTTGHHNS